MKEFFSKKIFSLTLSNLVFLIVGIFLVIGAGIAYSSWNDAKTGGSGEMSEANWNALVSMLETSGGGGCYVSYSGSCLSGFTNKGSAGSWRTCGYVRDNGTTWSIYKPSGDSCGGGSWMDMASGSKNVCCL